MYKLTFVKTQFSVIFNDEDELGLLLDIERTLPRPMEHFYNSMDVEDLELSYIGDDEEVKVLFVNGRIDLSEIKSFLECLEWIDNHHNYQDAMTAFEYLLLHRNENVKKIHDKLDEVRIARDSLADVCQNEQIKINQSLEGCNFKQFIDWEAWGEFMVNCGEYEAIDENIYVTNANQF